MPANSHRPECKASSRQPARIFIIRFDTKVFNMYSFIDAQKGYPAMTTAQKMERPIKHGFADEKVPGLLEELRSLRPMLQKNAPLGEELRSPAPEPDRALRKLGIYTLLTPSRWGGGGISCCGFAKVQMELAKGDPSLSWVAQILNGTTMVATLGSDALQEGLFGNGPTNICGAYNPPGKAQKVDGGYIVNGFWPYSSGSRQAEWVQGGCSIEEGGGPVMPGINMAYIPMEQIEIKDTWYVTGMQGTGSDTTIARDVLFPLT